MSVKYQTIVADPPWSYRISTGVQGAVGEQYSTMTNADIASLPVASIAAPNAHLYMWVTNPRLFAESHDDCGPIDIVRAWGFEYKTMLTWVKKPGLGIGYYFRGDTEHVLFAVRGSLPIPASDRESNTLTAPRRGHSAKPECFFDLVERVSPGPYLEMFARRARFGWDYWGNQSLGTAEMGRASDCDRLHCNDTIGPCESCSQSFRSSNREIPANGDFKATTGIEPVDHSDGPTRHIDKESL